MPGVLFRVDAGPGIGLGHLQRCLSLADALRSKQADCLFLSNRGPLNGERISASGFPSEELAAASWGPEDLEQTRRAAARHGLSAVVIDSRGKGPDYLQGLLDAGLRVCAIEDLAPFPFPCQLVVNGDAHAPQLRYESSSGATRFLLGPEYSVLRREFWESGQAAKQRLARPPRRVLITLGGADPHNLMPPLIRAAGNLPEKPEITAILGPYFERRGEIEREASAFSTRVRLVDAPTSVRSLMEEADLAVSAAGQTLYELARTGCPAVSFVMGTDQQEQLQAIAEAGAVLSAGNSLEGDLCGRIAAAVRRLLADATLRARLSEAGQRLVDGQGARRVAEEVLK